MSRVLTENPLQQGLKHLFFISFIAESKVLTENPLQQGLKLRVSQKETVYIL